MAKSAQPHIVRCPDPVLRLVQRFSDQVDLYKKATYNETQVRREFIDPLFRSLGWDVDNEAGYAEAYKDVIHEDSIKVGGSTKAPDYCFRIGGVRKFFVEAKKPSIAVKDDPGPAYQLRRYAWTNKLSLSIVTDFEEFAVYDGRIKPKPTDKPSTARVLYITYDEYPKRWAEISSIFSHNAILKGSFDRYAESNKRKRGTAAVDDEFLKEIEQWRELLARNIALRNGKLTVRELNYAVTKTIDRIIFLRMCEDRGVETYAQLRTLPNGPRIYPRLVELFRCADERYNSGLFHFREEKDRAEAPDELTPGLAIDDKVLKGIIQGLYYPECPYEFSVMPVEILGQVYEQFLGKVIRLTKGHRAVVEEKPEVKKAGGVYYTPKYIVDYIVEHTVGKLLEGKSPVDLGLMLDQRKKPVRARKDIGTTKAGRKQAKTLRILDPACGSGSFLLGAYQYLLDWHLTWYIDNDPQAWFGKKNPPIYQSHKPDAAAKGASWKLTVAERKRILLGNIYGVDIDPHAVEVTKLSLLLKVLEGENRQTLDNQLRLFHERTLPDLGSNIKCGNSLIGPDFYDNKQLDLLDEEERYRVNVFDWEAEFPDAFASGGFDAVVGNPPYRRELDYKHLLDEISATDFGRKHRSPRMDLWYYFAHRGLELLKPNCPLSFIVNAYWISGTGAEKLTSSLREANCVEEVFALGKLKVFKRVSGQHMIVRFASGKRDKCVTKIKTARPTIETTAEPFVKGKGRVEVFYKTRKQLFRAGKVDLQPVADELLAKIERDQLDSFGMVRQGIAENPASINAKTNAKFGDRWTIGEGVFAISSGELSKLSIPKKERILLRPYHDLCDVGRYRIVDSPSTTLIYSTRKTCPHVDAFPTIKAHLTRFRPVMEQRRETRKGSNSWWHLHWPRDEEVWRAKKLIAVQMARRPSFVPAPQRVYVPFSLNVFVPSEFAHEHLYYFAALLNSRLLWKWFTHEAKRRGVGLEINGNVLSRAPIRTIDFDDPADKTRHDRMVELVERMLSLHKQLLAAKTPTDKTAIQRQIDGTDRRIDQFVYKLYELTDDEIRIVEEATR